MKNIIKHIILITKHKWLVFIFCCKIGIPFRGFMHDWSKYSPTEFLESIKYYKGDRSPIVECKKIEGYSKAWLHHKGRNKHHPEYWVDETAPDSTPVMPYKYVAEMICDKLAACKIYNGKNFTNSSELEYWKKERKESRINKKVSNMLTEVFTQVSKQGINATLTKKNIKELYKKHCGPEYLLGNGKK